DYIAAVQTRLAMPDADAALQAIADYRTVTGLSAGIFVIRDQRNDTMGHTNATETVSGQAIREALNLTPEYLQELRTMSKEERREQLAIEAQAYEDRLKEYETAEYETGIINELEKREELISERLSEDPYARAYQIARSLLEDDCPYKPNSREYRILE